MKTFSAISKGLILFLTVTLFSFCHGESRKVSNKIEIKTVFNGEMGSFSVPVNPKMADSHIQIGFDSNSFSYTIEVNRRLYKDPHNELDLLLAVLKSDLEVNEHSLGEWEGQPTLDLVVTGTFYSQNQRRKIRFIATPYCTYELEAREMNGELPADSDFDLIQNTIILNSLKSINKNPLKSKNKICITAPFEGRKISLSFKDLNNVLTVENPFIFYEASNDEDVCYSVLIDDYDHGLNTQEALELFFNDWYECFFEEVRNYKYSSWKGYSVLDFDFMSKYDNDRVKNRIIVTKNAFYWLDTYYELGKNIQHNQFIKSVRIKKRKGAVKDAPGQGRA